MRSHLLKLLAVICTASSCWAFIGGTSLAAAARAARTTPSGLRMATEEGKKAKEKWPLREFVRTVMLFNRPKPPSPRAVVSRIVKRRKGEKSAEAALTRPELGGGVVLVTGATGGVGSRVVKRLLEQGVSVRALARNRLKAEAILGQLGKEEGQGSLEIAVGDLTDAATLKPSVLKDAIAVASCTAAIVQPREVDDKDRSKYFQGIKFYEPEVLDVPEEVEYKGIKNLLSGLSKYSDLTGKKLFSCEPANLAKWNQWGSLDDVVMGGVSSSGLEVVGADGSTKHDKPVAVFSGEVSTNNNGGFASIRTRSLDPVLDLSAYDGISLRVKGDGNRFKFTTYDSSGWDRLGYCSTFDTKAGDWQDIYLPFSEMVPVFRAKSDPSAAPMNRSTVHSFQLMLSKFMYDGELNPNFTAGDFRIEIESIKAVKSPAAGARSRIVHISSAGVTRLGKPGLVVEEQPPAVRMNDMLGGLLTWKLRGEDAIRESGIPATIIRPCALTEEASGAPLVLAQGDEIKGKISRDDVAELISAAVMSTEAAGLTLEAKTDIPFSEVWTREKGAEERNYSELYGSLKAGVTGKEWMEDKVDGQNA
ncbi:unnamed protein product [Chrysoparadoxa australica]